MSTSWMIPTQNDPLGTVREVLHTLWITANLECILAPQNGAGQTTSPVIFSDPEKIAHFNPFTPLMPINAVQRVPELLGQGDPVAAVLRPCEMRTLNAMVELDRLKTDNLMTICVDCLGTLPADEFEWRAQRKGSPKGLAQEALQFAHQGGIVPYRYRAACQICESPEATQADVNIGVLGLPVRQYLIINIQDEQIASFLPKEESIPKDAELLSQHHKVVARLAERGRETRERIFTGLGDMLPTDFDSLVEPLQGCDDCRSCLNVCPICTSDFPRQEGNGEYVREDVMEWLVSCSGCGMCEQACPKHLPLTIIFGHIRDQLAEV
jgi:formate dehydrogenase (coenzyme F420) beta subunit